MLATHRWFRAAVCLALAARAASAFPHTMPERSDPGAGAMLHQAPAAVSIRFDADLEPVFSSLVVKNAAGEQVSEGKGVVGRADARMLSTRLTSHAKGAYHVYWRAVSRDGHRTEGDYGFNVD